MEPSSQCGMGVETGRETDTEQVYQKGLWGPGLELGPGSSLARVLGGEQQFLESELLHDTSTWSLGSVLQMHCLLASGLCWEEVEKNKLIKESK